MNILCNGEATQIQSVNLAQALIELGFADTTVATAVNETFVAATERESRHLANGDRIEVLAPMQGG